jgi:ABC-type nitrate/sulfonate/bicarbonate transport system permease component
MSSSRSRADRVSMTSGSVSGDRHRDSVRAFALVGVLLVVWEVAGRLGLIGAETAPPPSVVARSGAELFTQNGLAYDLGVTLTYVVVGFAITVVTGVVAGLVLGASSWVSRVSAGFLTFLLSIPKSLFLPLFILVVGIGATQKIAFGVFSSFAVMVVATMAGLQGLDDGLVRMGRSQGASRWQLFTRIYLRSMTPTLLEAARIAMVLNITGVLIAEMYVSREGLGFLISTYSQTFQVDRLMAVIAVATAIGIGFNELMRLCERRQDRWREGAS